MIRGQRINIRLVEEADLENVHKLQSEIREKGMYTDITLKSITQLKKKFQDDGMTRRDFGMFLIEDKEENLVGMVQHFKGYMYSTGFELGAVIFKKEDRSKGYMTEAVRLYCAYLFEANPIKRIELNTATSNIGMQKVAEKCGFSYEGTIREACYIRGIATDLKKYGILRNESKSLEELLG